MAKIVMSNGEEFEIKESIQLIAESDILVVDSIEYVLINNKWEKL